MNKVLYVVNEVAEWILAFVVVVIIISLMYTVLGALIALGLNNTVGKAFEVHFNVLDTAIAVWLFNIAYQIWDALFGKGPYNEVLNSLGRGGNNPTNSIPTNGCGCGPALGSRKNLC